MTDDNSYPQPRTQADIRARELLDALWNDADVGRVIQAKAKERWSDIPTIDELAQPVVAPLKKELDTLQSELKTLREEREAEAKAAQERADAAQKRTFEEAIEAARRNYNLTDEGFDKMVARMKETGNYQDPDAAAAWVASKNPPPSQPSSQSFGPQALNFWGSQKHDDALADLHRDPMGYMDAQLNDFVRDPDRYVRETFGQ